MRYSADDLAKYIVNKCIIDKCPISNSQLQKILYCIQREYLRMLTEIFDDDFEAWPIGPVIPEVYNRYAGYGNEPIDLPETGVQIGAADAHIIDQIIESKRALDPWELFEDIQKNGTAWSYTFDHGAGNGKIISKVSIIMFG